MPLARSNTRSRSFSRSPAPPSTPKFSAISRPFLPPSHYAAAAGIPYNGPKSEEQTGSLSFSSNRTEKLSNSDAISGGNSLVPIDYPPQIEIDAEYNPAAQESSSRANFRDRRSSQVQAKTRSQLGDLPLLEAQLLPSLRDTIDRMTRPPSRGTHPHPSLESSSRFNGSSWSSNITSTVSSLSLPQPPVHYSRSAPSTPKLPSVSVPSQPSDSAKTKTKSNPKPILKSFSHSGTPKLANIIQYNTLSPARLHRQEQNETTEKPKVTSRFADGNDVNGGSKKTNPESKPSRTRSRTDPGTAMTRKQPSPSTPFVSSSAFKSGIPRRIRSDDDSDVEYRPGRHRLMVTNATVVPSSSSESEPELRTPTFSSRMVIPSIKSPGSYQLASDRIRGHTSDNRWESPSTGLGLHASPETVDHSKLDSWGRSGVTESESDEESIHLHSWGPKLEERESRKRKEALMGLVNGLVLDHGHTQDVTDRPESFYDGQQGLAISGSGDLSTNAQWTHGNSEYQPSWRRKRKSSDRSSTPHLPISSDKDSNQHFHSQPEPPFAFTPLNKPQSRCLSAKSGTLSSTNISRRETKSPLRSPVMRQSTEDDVPLALRRYSVYYPEHQVQVPTDNVPVSYSITNGQKEASNPDRLEDEHENTSATWQVDHHYKEDTRGLQRANSLASDAVSLAESSYAAALREREAFGLPPSMSDRAMRDYPEGLQERYGRDSMSHSGSDLSSVADSLGREDCDELSVGAETLFRKLSIGHERGSHRFERVVSYPKSSIPPAASFVSDASSVYEDGDEPVIQPSNSSTDNSFSEIPPLDHKKRLDHEARRQEVIRTLARTEQELSDRLGCVVRLFIQPLRIEHTKTWVEGVPSEITRLFDWLDDIVNLHSQIASALQQICGRQDTPVECVAESLRAFVPKFEVYQPYLVRLEEVADMINQSVSKENGESDFGEFVRLQQSRNECGGWTLERFLVEPVNRLAKYPDFFQQLLDCTPSHHKDYLATLSLYHSTDMVIRVMGEVKVREEEYDHIKNISTRIQGLPPTAHLARRERRLLARKRLYQVQLNNLVAQTEEPNASQAQRPAPELTNDKLKRNTRLFDVINEWKARRGRSGSIKSTASTAISFKTYDTTSLPLSTDEHGRVTPTSVVPPERVLVELFVFTDLVLLVEPVLGEQLFDSMVDSWSLLDEVGISRIVGVTELPSSADITLVRLELLPMKVQDLNAGAIPNGPVITLHLSCSDLTPSSRHGWIHALRQCSHFNLQSLAFPSHTEQRFIHEPNIDLELDTRQTMATILTSGLPLPKSPSVQIEDLTHEHRFDTRKQEREERGWWSLRFHQVLREMHRQEITLENIPPES